MIYSIYLITNNVNQKKYVGVTYDFAGRMRGHKGCYSDSYLSRAILKYGWDNFSKEVIFQSLDKDFAYKEAESLFIKEYSTKDPQFGYNLTDGGEGSPGYIVSNATREKQRLAKVGKRLSEDHKSKISIGNTGKKFSDETKNKISERLKGNKNFSGKTFSKEVLHNLSEQKAKDWTLMSPSGDIVHIHNMRKFCLENNLSSSAMSRVIIGKQPHHKNWTKLPCSLLQCTMFS